MLYVILHAPSVVEVAHKQVDDHKQVARYSSKVSSGQVARYSSKVSSNEVLKIAANLVHKQACGEPCAQTSSDIEVK
jgi:hypothetical protein